MPALTRACERDQPFIRAHGLFRARRSLALYYYTNGRPTPIERHETIWTPNRYVEKQ